jgi:hypothetical protein
VPCPPPIRTPTREPRASQIEDWRRDYNEFRPHSSLGERTPREFLGSGDWMPRGTRRPKTDILSSAVFQVRSVHSCLPHCHAPATDWPMRTSRLRVSCAPMIAQSRRRMAFALLLAALAQPAWAVAHATVHEHLAAHHEEATHSHHPASVLDVRESEAQPRASARGSHEHGHEHLVAVYLRPTGSTDPPSLAALPSTTSSPCAVATRQREINREAAPSRASPEASGPSNPRAPPIA